MALKVYFLEPAESTTPPARGRSIFTADLEAEKPSSGFRVGDTCRVAESQKLYVCYANDVWTDPPSGGGEVNTASNVGTSGTGVFHQKTGVNLELRKLNAASARVTVALNGSQIDVDVPASAFEAAGAVAAHEAAGDPHAQYSTASEATAIADAAVATHAAAADPHAGYQKESEKGQANGYASLGAGGLVPVAQMASGTPDGTKFVADDGTLKTPAGGGGGPSTVKSTADQTKTDATLVNVTGCSFSLTSGVYYAFRFLIVFRSSVATVGLKVGLTFPGVTRFACTVQIPIAVAGPGGVRQGYITASGGSDSGTAVPAINTDYCAVVEGVILPSANGTLQLQFAAETTGATVTCRQGTCGILQTLP